ncbi:hypothetical protein CSKR_103423, partial [Clonorchis sinensis]
MITNLHYPYSSPKSHYVKFSVRRNQSDRVWKEAFYRKTLQSTKPVESCPTVCKDRASPIKTDLVCFRNLSSKAKLVAPTQTLNRRYFNACDWPELKTVQQLMTCNSFRQTSEFILKVSQFSELNYVPNFHRSHPVYFMAGKKLCKEAHMKIIVELTSSDKALHDSTSG